jgi:hypothetical protein
MYPDAQVRRTASLDLVVDEILTGDPVAAEETLLVDLYGCRDTLIADAAKGSEGSGLAV